MDAHCVNVKFVLRVGPGDDLRVDGSVDNSLVGENASPQHCSSIIMFLFLWESQRIVTAQEDEDFARVGCGRVSCTRPPLLPSWERKGRTVVEI